MNSRFMMFLAVFLVMAAVLVGYFGVSLSRNDSAAPPPPAAPVLPPDASVLDAAAQKTAEVRRLDVIVLARDLPAYQPITNDDLIVERMRLVPPGSFGDPRMLVGRAAWRDLPAGSILTESSFSVGGPVARMIRSNERALAIKYDELMGVGGHLAPGDFVDVLLYLREDERNSDRTMQVVVPALRVLSVGDKLGLALSGKPAQELKAADDDKAQKARREPKVSNAVLAVPTELLTRFALAAEVGDLKLALRSAQEHRLESFYTGALDVTEELNQQLFQFEKFAISQASRPQPGLIPPAPKPAPAPPSVTVIRGGVSSQETP